MKALLHMDEIIMDVVVYNIAVVLSKDANPTDAQLSAAELLASVSELEEDSVEYAAIFSTINALSNMGYLNVRVGGI